MVFGLENLRRAVLILILILICFFFWRFVVSSVEKPRTKTASFHFCFFNESASDQFC